MLVVGDGKDDYGIFIAKVLLFFKIRLKSSSKSR